MFPGRRFQAQKHLVYWSQRSPVSVTPGRLLGTNVTQTTDTLEEGPFKEEEQIHLWLLNSSAS